MRLLKILSSLVAIALLLSPSVFAAEGLPLSPDAENPAPAQDQNPLQLALEAGPSRDGLIHRSVSFNVDTAPVPRDQLVEVLWDFGDGTRASGARVAHTYTKPGTFLVKLRVSTTEETVEDTTEVRIFRHLAVLVADHSAPADQIELQRQQAAKAGILLLPVTAKNQGPEVLVEEDLTRQLLDIRPALDDSYQIIVWTSGGVGANVLTKFAQHLRQSDGISLSDLSLNQKGIILLSETPFGVLKPTAQSAYDQLEPAYVLITRPQVLDLLLTATSSEEAKNVVLESPIEHRLLGPYSSRTVSDIGITNFMSFGISFLVNRGVPINSIILILMLPVIATILAFARQVIGIKAFGIITPAMTTLSFLVMGLRYGLIVFIVVLLSGTVTRVILRRLRLLYLPRMALVLTSVSLSLLLVLGLGVATDRNSILSFSIFPALILTLLAEEFISAQFKSGPRAAFGLTGWTLVLSTTGYFIVSSEIFRTLILSFPEITLLTIPVNIVLGQWSGLRLTEFFRFRQLLRYVRPPSQPS